VIPTIHEQALYFEGRRNRQTMRTTVLPGMMVEGGDRSLQRLAHAKNLPLLRKEGGARSLHRMRSRHALLVDLPTALKKKECRLAWRQAFHGILPNIREKVAEKQRMEALVLLAGHHERVMASVRAYRRNRNNRTYPHATTTKTTKATCTTETTETQDQAIFFLLFFFLASFWLVVITMFIAVFFMGRHCCREVAVETNTVVTDVVRETERILSIMERKHDVSTSRRVRRAKARPKAQQEKKRSKRFMTQHYVFLKH